MIRWHYYGHIIALPFALSLRFSDSVHIPYLWFIVPLSLIMTGEEKCLYFHKAKQKWTKQTIHRNALIYPNENLSLS